MIYTNQEIEEARNSKVKDRRVYKSRRINNFRELVSYSVEHYAEHIAYKYKNKPSDKEIIKKTYAEAGMDIKAFGTEMLNRGAKKIAVIGILHWIKMEKRILRNFPILIGNGL